MSDLRCCGLEHHQGKWYVADSNPEEDSKDGPVDYPDDEGYDDDDDNSSDYDDEEEEASQKDEYLASTDSIVAPVVDWGPHETFQFNQPLNIQNELDNHELFINELIQQKLQNENAQFFLAIAIILDLPSVEPKDSLRMGDEHLYTILETELDEFIKYSVENLVPNPCESKDEHEFDVPSFSDEDISKEIYSNPLFDEEIISIKIDLHHFNVESDLIESLLSQDSSIISSSSKIDSLLDEFAGELFLLKSIPPGIDEANCDPEEEICLIEKLLYDNSSHHPPEEFISKNSDAEIESFSPSPIPVEDNDDYDSERDILILEELLINDSLSLLENESFYFNIPSSPRPPAKPPDDDKIKPNSGILTVKVVGDISK
nr:hypothetical protein [Tanacetum cinerariifolium]